MKISQLVIAALIGALSYAEVTEAVQLKSLSSLETFEEVAKHVHRSRKHHTKKSKHAKKHAKAQD